MKILSEILFVISNGLMIPVLGLLLYLSARAVSLLFAFCKEYSRKKRIAGMFRHLIQNYSPDGLAMLQTETGEFGDSSVIDCLRNIMAHKTDKIYCEHALSEFHIDVQKQLSRHKALIKFGPMLGLMGTLIPMGPALVGLASGDIVSMAYNMQVAFSTTVVGMAVAAIGAVTLQGNKRYYARSLNDLDFVFQKLNEK